MTAAIIVFILGAAMFVAGVALSVVAVRQKSPVELPPKYPDLLRMAIRMHYVSHEGTLSKSGSVVRFDADGPESADEFIETVLALVELAD